LSGVIPTNIPAAPQLVISRPDLPNPYSMEWSLEVQHQLSNNMSVSLGYLGSHSLRLPVELNNDLRPPTATLPDGTSNYQVGVPGVPLAQVLYDPNYAQIFITSPIGNANYNSGLLTFRRNVSHGIGAQVNYTFSRGIDNNVGLSTNSTPEDEYHPELDRSVSSESATHRLI